MLSNAAASCTPTAVGHTNRKPQIRLTIVFLYKLFTGFSRANKFDCSKKKRHQFSLNTSTNLDLFGSNKNQCYSQYE